jgi:hypothetical protein
MVMESEQENNRNSRKNKLSICTNRKGIIITIFRASHQKLEEYKEVILSRLFPRWQQ